MKKILLSSLVFSSIAFSSCEKDVSLTSTTTKDKKDIPTPNASFTVTAVNATGNTITLQEGVPVSVRTVVIRYTGTPTDFKAVYPGDATRTYIPNPATPPVTAQSGLTFASDSLSHTYAGPGTYPITVVATNVGDKGREFKRSVATRTITLN